LNSCSKNKKTPFFKKFNAQQNEQNRSRCAFEKTFRRDSDLQLVVGADDLKSIERDIDDFFANKKMAQMIVTSPGRLLTGAIRFGLGKNEDTFLRD